MRLSDLLVLLSVARCGSMTGAARQHHVKPASVSKAIARLEQQLGARLINRGTRGIQLSEQGRRVIPEIEQAFRHLRRLSGDCSALAPELVLAGSCFLCALLVPGLGSALPALRLRVLEVPPILHGSLAADDVVDVLFTTRGHDLPARWVQLRLGELRRALFASPRVARAIGEAPTLEALEPYPLVRLSCLRDGRLVPADGGGGAVGEHLSPGHEVQTVGAALEMAAHCDQLVLAPVASARAHLCAGTLVELAVAGAGGVDPVYLACDGARVPAALRRALSAAVRELLVKLAADDARSASLLSPAETAVAEPAD
jgi:DNA-binding transcriptional LysR family regulator